MQEAPKMQVTVLGSTASAADVGGVELTSSTTGKGFIALGDVIKQGLAGALYSKNGIYMVVLLNNAEL